MVHSTLTRYLDTGYVGDSISELETLITELATQNLLTLSTTDYSLKFLQIKLREDWYRRHRHQELSLDRRRLVTPLTELELEAISDLYLRYLYTRGSISQGENQPRTSLNAIAQRQRGVTTLPYEAVTPGLNTLSQPLRYINKTPSVDGRPRVELTTVEKFYQPPLKYLLVWDLVNTRPDNARNLLNRLERVYHTLTGESYTTSFTGGHYTYYTLWCCYKFMSESEPIEYARDGAFYLHELELLTEGIANRILTPHCVLAGGAVLNYINQWNVQQLEGDERVQAERAIRILNLSSDYDVFFVDCDPELANECIERIASIMDPRAEVCRSPQALTFTGKNLNGRRISGKAQCILRIYSDIEELLVGFDLDASGVAYDGETFYATERARYSLGFNAQRQRLLTVDFDRLSPSYEARLTRYGKCKLFDLEVPELPSPEAQTQLVEQSPSGAGLSSLVNWSRYGRRFTSTPVDYAPVNRPLVVNAWEDGVDFMDGRLNRPQADDVNSETPVEEWIEDAQPVNVGFILSTVYYLQDSNIQRALRHIGVPSDLIGVYRFKTYRPGDQVTGSFHRIVLEDPRVWYSN